jgi:hypothetical protein
MVAVKSLQVDMRPEFESAPIEIRGLIIIQTRKHTTALPMLESK